MLNMLKKIDFSRATGNCIAFVKKHPIVFRLILFGILYFFIRSGWQGSIEFGYDTGRLSMAVLEILDRNELALAPQYVLRDISVGSLSWGPIFFYTVIPFFLVSHNPLIITNMLIVFQFLGIVAMYFAVEILYNKRVAFFSTVFIIAFPWHVIFSRMIYNPSLLLWIIPLVVLVTLLIVKKEKQKLLFVLPFLWFSMIQYHVVGILVLILSLVYLVIHFRKITWKYFRIGLFLGIIPLLPVLLFDMQHNFDFSKKLFETKKEHVAEKNDPLVVIKQIGDDTVGTVLLTDFENHLGYAQDYFFKKIPFIYNSFHPLYVGLLLISILFFIAKILWKPKADDIFVFSWLLSVPAFLIVFNFNNAEVITSAQRYFLPTFFPVGIIIGCMFDKALEFTVTVLEFAATKIKFKKLRIKTEKVLNAGMYFLSAFFVFIFFIFMITYHTFLINYDYPEEGFFGWLSWDSGPPALSIYRSIDYALKDAKKSGFDSIVISDSWGTSDSLKMNNYQQYFWTNVFKKTNTYSKNLPFYFICLGPSPSIIPRDEIKQFGPWRVYKKKKVDNKCCNPNDLLRLGSEKEFSLISDYSGKAFDILYAQTNDGAPAIIYDFHGEANQCLRFVESEEKGYYYIVSSQTGKYLDIAADNRVVIKSQKRQKWRLEINNKTIRIITRENEYSIAVENSNPNNFTPVIVEPSSNNQNQIWRVLYY